MLVAIALFVIPFRAAFAEPQSLAPAAELRVAEARRHFELGVVHFDRKEWPAALAEFLRSRELAPTRANTKNAAICLRKVGRFDEALGMFEALIRDFPDLPPADRELVQRELAELHASIGTLEIRDAPAGSRVIIDGFERGTTPLAGPLRLPAGTHFVRVVKDGSLPFEARVDVAGREAKVLSVRFAALTHAGRLRVTEKDGKRVEVFIDGSQVGTAPWDGVLAPGVHSVALRGEGNLGTPPTQVTVALEKESLLDFVARPLESELAILAKPDRALIHVDGVLAGFGAWQGRVDPGLRRIDVTFGGYKPFSRTLLLKRGDTRVVPVALEPFTEKKARIALELDSGLPVGVLWGGDLANGCDARCSSSLPVGVYTGIHALYRTSVGVGVGVHAGYFSLWKTLTQRQETVSVINRPRHAGVVDDHLRLAGLMAGAEADYVAGEQWPVSLRLLAGALIGTVMDTRSGSFVDSLGSAYDTSARLVPRASYLYLGPEIRAGYRFGGHFEASLGVKLLVLAALERPFWDGGRLVYAGATDRGGYFPEASMTGDILLVMLPGLTAGYVF